MSGIDIGGDGRREDSGARLISSGDTTSGKQFGGNASRGFGVAIDGVSFRMGGNRRSDGIDTVMKDAVKQAAEEDTTGNPKREANIVLLTLMGFFACAGLVHQYKAITKGSTTEPTSNATPHGEAASGSLQADVISRMTFEAQTAPQTQPVQNKKPAPTLKL